MNAVGKAPAITRRDSSATLPPKVRSFGVKLSLRAYTPMRVQRLGRRVSSILAIVLTGKARNVLVLLYWYVVTDCIFAAIWQVQEI